MPENKNIIEITVDLKTLFKLKEDVLSIQLLVNTFLINSQLTFESPIV